MSELPSYCHPEEIARVRELWYSKLSQQKVTIVSKVSIAEQSFKELMKDQPGVEFNKSGLIKILKDMRHQSFGGKNIFEHPMIDQTRQVHYQELALKNPVTPPYHTDPTWWDHGSYEPWLDLFTIDLVTPKWSVGSRARIAIGQVPFTDDYVIGVQFFVDLNQSWVFVPSRTMCIMDLITSMFPQE